MAHIVRVGRYLCCTRNCTRQKWQRSFLPNLSQFSCNRSIANYTHGQYAGAISVLPTKVDASAAEYKQNASQMTEAIERMQKLHTRIEAGGPSKAKDKHIARGKMLPREYAQLSRRTIEGQAKCYIVVLPL